MSVEVDMAPMHDDDAGTLATLLDGVLGELSMLHETNGFYVQGVGRETAVLPAGWERRLVPVVGPNTNGRTGLCLDPHDLCLAKLAASREKDFRFLHALVDAGLISLEVLAARVETSALPTLAPASRLIAGSPEMGPRQVVRVAESTSDGAANRPHSGRGGGHSLHHDETTH